MACIGLLLCASAAPPVAAVPDVEKLMAYLEKNDDVLRLEFSEVESGGSDKSKVKRELRELKRKLAKNKGFKSRRNDIEHLAREILKSGDINQRDSQGRTLAMLVVECNSTPAMKLVLDDEPDLSLRDQYGRTVMDYERRGQGQPLQDILQDYWERAFESGDGKAIPYLLSCGIPPECLLKGDPALGRAIKSGKQELVDIMIAQCPPVSARMVDGTSMMELAVCHNMPGVIRYLLMGGCDVNELMGNGEHPFFHLVTRGSAEAVRAWVDTATKMDTKLLPSSNPACVAARYGTPEALSAVLDSKPNLLNQQDNFGNTPLIEAARRGNTEMVADLLKRGARADVVSKWKETPLMGAAMSGNAEAVCALLKAAPSVRGVKDRYGKTAAAYARQSGNAEALKALEADEVR